MHVTNLIQSKNDKTKNKYYDVGLKISKFDSATVRVMDESKHDELTGLKLRSLILKNVSHKKNHVIF